MPLPKPVVIVIVKKLLNPAVIKPEKPLKINASTKEIRLFNLKIAKDNTNVKGNMTIIQ